MAGGAVLAVSPRLARAQERALPFTDLGASRTRVTTHAALARALGLGSLHVKRDDESGAEFGGSKARKLERLLGAARRERRDAVLTFGGVGSNHALATAIHARRLGMRAHLVLLHEPPSPHVRRHLLAALHAGAELHAGTRADRDVPGRAVARFAAADDPYVIPPGGTSGLGGVGYVDAALELRRQIDAGALPAPDAIYVAAGTTGTAAGLWVGLQAAQLPARLIAVRASGRATASRARVQTEVDAIEATLRGTDATFAAAPLDDRFELEHRFAGEGYARPTDAGRRARALAGSAFPLDDTYTAKAFAALVARAGAHRGRPVLFWDTFDPRRPPIGAARVEDLPRRLRAYARE